MADNKNNTQNYTITQIRNFYSEGMSYMNVKFCNTNLALNFYPFTGRDSNGLSSYDRTNSLSTTVDFKGAFALYQAAKDIIDGNIKETDITIPCAAGASILFQCKLNVNNQVDAIISIMKNNVTIPFKFSVMNQTIKHNNGQIENRVIQVGLGAFMKTVEGYLTGINADRHLDKLTEDYVKSIQGSQSTTNNNIQPNQNNNQQNNRNNNYRGNYNSNGNYKKGYNNNNYKRQYNNNNSNGGFPAPPSNNNWNNNSQNLSSYEINN